MQLWAIYYSYRDSCKGIRIRVLLSAVCAYINCEKQKEDKLMTVRFHPPEEQVEFAERVLAILVQAALPQVTEQLEQVCQQESRETQVRSA